MTSASTIPAGPAPPSSYAQQSPWTEPGPHAARLAALSADPAGVAEIVSGLVLHPAMLETRGIVPPQAARADPALRTVRAVLDALLERNAAALDVARPPAERVLAMCASFALLAAAILRAHGVEARLRCGFASYFTVDFFVDHWVCEYRAGAGWRLLDAELERETRAQFAIGFAAHDVPPGDFTTASAMWQALAQGRADPQKVGVPVPGIVGPWFVAGSLLRDAAALAMQETQVWDYWGISRALRPGSTLSPAERARFDALAQDLATPPPTPAAARALIARHDGTALTPTVLSFPFGAPIEVPALP